MGQCSTLPADAVHQNNNNGGGGNNNRNYHPSHAASGTASRSSRKSSSGAYPFTGIRQHSSRSHAHYAHAQQQRDDSDVIMADADDNGGKPVNVAAMVAAAKKCNNAFEPYMNEAGGAGQSKQQSQQKQSRSQSRSRSRSSSRRRTASEHREPTSTIPPPDGSEKKRCYRLNLEMPSAPSVDPVTGQQIYGPLIYEPPAHHMPGGGNGTFRKASSWHSATAGMHALQVSNSADTESKDEESKSEVAIAISTAQIFRGITVDKNGTILTQNARASRSARKSGGDKQKVGEKSRQAAKIDKAKDLVDEDGPGGLDPDSKTQCLYIMGEYDDMKYLVKDGAKKLRDATNLSDDALLSINRQRTSSQSFSNPSTPMSNRKRISPYTSSGGNAVPTRSRSNRSLSQQNTPQNGPSSAPPKLKANPRDSRSTRRMGADPTGDCMDSENAHYNATKQCNEIGLTFGKKGQDWSEALNLSNKLGNIWNCGADVNSDSTMSPTSMNSPNSKQMTNAFALASACGAGSSMPLAREGRNESIHGARGDGRFERVDATGNVVA